MSFRFLKKKDGTKILQYKDPVKNYAWEDVPMVEEDPAPSDRLHKALNKFPIHSHNTIVILVNKKFYDSLIEENKKRIGIFYAANKINSFYQHRIYLVEDMAADFKFVKEEYCE